MPILTVELSHPDLPEAAGLIDALSDHLLRHYGADGRASFGAWGAAPARSAFVLARSSGIAVACGAIRPLDGDDAEVKRMYATPGHPGAAAAVLGLLEAEASRLGYRTLRLATRRANERAVGFYRKHGFVPCPNYAAYAGRPESVCLEKPLV
jgi:GNAT superfamily N-acetyltransferase